MWVSVARCYTNLPRLFADDRDDLQPKLFDARRSPIGMSFESHAIGPGCAPISSVPSKNRIRFTVQYEDRRC